MIRRLRSEPIQAGEVLLMQGTPDAIQVFSAEFGCIPDKRRAYSATIIMILGPGGFRFGDYWKLGLPLEILVIIICVIVLPLFWPL